MCLQRNNDKKSENKFIYLRRRDIELQICCSEFGNPFKKINEDLGSNISVKSEKKIIYLIDENTNTVIGYGAALSNFSTLRGVDLSDVDLIFFDEFMPHQESRPIPNEADVFFNLYETVNRNREMLGYPPCMVILASNSVQLSSPILVALDLIRAIEKMIANGQQILKDKSRGLMILLPNLEEFKNVKSQTALYKLTKGSRYSKHALNNEFSYDSFVNIARCPLDEYLPYIGFGEIYIYKHKFDNKYYACTVPCDCEYYPDTKEGRLMFKRRMFIHKEWFINGKIKYADYKCKLDLWEIMM